MSDSQIIQIYGLSALAFGAIFLYQGAINFFIHRQGVLSPQETKPISYLCLFSSLYSFGSFYLAQDHPRYLNPYALVCNWVTGSLIIHFYIRAMMSYLGFYKPALRVLSIIPIVTAAAAAVAGILYVFTDINLVLDPLEPQIKFTNFFITWAGGFNPHIYLKILVPFILTSSLGSLVILLRHLILTSRVYSILTLGITLSFVGVILDVTALLDDNRFRYLPPLLFLSNFFEILRITYSNQIKVGSRVFELESDLIQSHKLAEAGDYFAHLSHEVANPLYAARSYFGLLISSLNQEEFSPKIRKYQKNIEEQFSHIQDMLNNVKDLTRPSPVKEFALESLNSIIHSSLEMTRLKAYHGNVSLKFVPDADILVPCLRDQMVQVLSNLINNAIEAIEDGSGWVEIKTTRISDSVEISVSDSGKGIPSDLQDVIFEKRFSTKNERGNGLGLSICKTIVANHRGDLFLNKNSQYTEFILRLPGA